MSDTHLDLMGKPLCDTSPRDPDFFAKVVTGANPPKSPKLLAYAEHEKVTCKECQQMYAETLARVKKNSGPADVH